MMIGIASTRSSFARRGRSTGSALFGGGGESATAVVMLRSPCTPPRRPHEKRSAHHGPDRSTRIRHPTESPSTCATRLSEAEDAIVVSEYRPGQRRQRDFDRLTVEIRVGHLPAVAEVSEHLIGDVLRIDLYDSGGNRGRRGRIGDRIIQVSHRVDAVTDDRDHGEDDRRQPQLAEYSAPASPLGPRAHTSIFRPGMTYSDKVPAVRRNQGPASQLIISKTWWPSLHPLRSLAGGIGETAASSCAAGTQGIDNCVRMPGKGLHGRRA